MYRKDFKHTEQQFKHTKVYFPPEKEKKNLLFRVDGFTVIEEFKNILGMR